MSEEATSLETLAAAASRYEILKADVEKADVAAKQARDASDKKDALLAGAKRLLADGEARLRRLAKSLL